MADSADLMSLGKHCFIETCKQLDFLPFKCTFCKGTFWVKHLVAKTLSLEHRTVSSHQCPNAHVKDIHVPICPVCGKIVKKSRNEDSDTQVNYHIQSGCKELVVSQKAKRENRCSLKGCKQHEVIPFCCNQCHRQFCVRHRHTQDHPCRALTMLPVVACAS